MPSSPRGWVRYAFRVLEAQSAPHLPRLDHAPRSDSRFRDSKETAISVKMMLEKSQNGWRGCVPKLLVRLYLGSELWDIFTDKQKHLMRKNERRFRRELVAAGLLPDPERREYVSPSSYSRRRLLGDIWIRGKTLRRKSRNFPSRRAGSGS